MRRLFGQRRAKTSDAPTPGGRVVYAIGDVHGCADLLASLVAAIQADAARLAPKQRPVIIFVGDYVDRGEGSRDVIDQVIALMDNPAFDVRALKGNHEEALLQFLDDPEFGQTWLEFGGGPTLRSYGVDAPRLRSHASEWRAAQAAFQVALPRHHLEFLRDLELMAIYGDYVFVHAGVRAGVALADQAESDLLWIRNDFIQATAPFEKVVVHGHTPEAAAFVDSRRIGIDTGAYATGVLTAVRLNGADRTILQASRNGAR
jgi:serine/threonine protein phosphatase 1